MTTRLKRNYINTHINDHLALPTHQILGNMTGLQNLKHVSPQNVYDRRNVKTSLVP